MGTRVSNGFGVVAVAVVVVVTAGPAGAQPARTPAEEALEREMHADVERASPTAATAYDEGNAAREARRLDEAVAAYRRAIELAPEVDHPHRRLCSVLELQGRLEEAVTECEAALRIRPDSPFNKVCSRAPSPAAGISRVATAVSSSRAPPSRNARTTRAS